MRVCVGAATALTGARRAAAVPAAARRVRMVIGYTPASLEPCETSALPYLFHRRPLQPVSQGVRTRPSATLIDVPLGAARRPDAPCDRQLRSGPARPRRDRAPAPAEPARALDARYANADRIASLLDRL